MNIEIIIDDVLLNTVLHTKLLREPKQKEIENLKARLKEIDIKKTAENQIAKTISDIIDDMIHEIKTDEKVIKTLESL